MGKKCPSATQVYYLNCGEALSTFWCYFMAEFHGKWPWLSSPCQLPLELLKELLDPGLNVSSASTSALHSSLQVARKANAKGCPVQAPYNTLDVMMWPMGRMSGAQ